MSFVCGFFWADFQGKVSFYCKIILPPPLCTVKKTLIKLNPLGKRVNHAARTVITPDPMIGIDEIGLPEVFAKSLTYPVGTVFIQRSREGGRVRS